MATAGGISRKQFPNSASCSRCGGFMIPEQCFDFLDSTGHLDFHAQRCVQCGDLVDPTILRNRQLQFADVSGTGRR